VLGLRTFNVTLRNIDRYLVVLIRETVRSYECQKTPYDRLNCWHGDRATIY